MFLSSLEDVADKAKGFELGANDYLTKPFEVLEVKARVRSLLKAKSYSDAVKAALERDLSIAREIQFGLLPSDLSACAEGTDLDLHAILEPAQHVGGDLYLALRTAPDRLFLAVGDVSGKGIPASLFMAVTMTLLRSLAREHPKPETVLTRLNEELEAHNRGQLFVTLICTVFDLSSGKVHVANAGHPSPVLLCADGTASTPFGSTGLIAGLFPKATYTSHTADFASGRHPRLLLRRRLGGDGPRGERVRRGEAHRGAPRKAARKREGNRGRRPRRRQAARRDRPAVRRHHDRRGSQAAGLKTSAYGALRVQASTSPFPFTSTNPRASNG